MNHQAMAQRGEADGVPPPRAGTLSIARLSQAMNAIAVAMNAPLAIQPSTFRRPASVLNWAEGRTKTVNRSPSTWATAIATFASSNQLVTRAREAEDRYRGSSRAASMRHRLPPLDYGLTAAPQIPSGT